MLPCSIWRYERARRKELLCGSRWLSIGVWSSMTPLLVPKRSHVHWMILCWSLPHNVWKSGSIELAASRTQAPVLMPAYLDLWSQTSPIPSAGPEVGLFLHGAERTPAEVSFVWRSDISSSDLSDHQGADRLKALMELVPPRAAEMIEVPLWSATRWLRSEQADATRLARVADAPGRDESDAFEDHGHEKRAFRWAGSDDPRTGIVSAAEIRPGDVLIVLSDYGGCDAFGWAPTSDAVVADVADDAARPFRGRRHTVRIARNDTDFSFARGGFRLENS